MSMQMDAGGTEASCRELKEFPAGTCDGIVVGVELGFSREVAALPQVPARLPGCCHQRTGRRFRVAVVANGTPLWLQDTG